MRGDRPWVPLEIEVPSQFTPHAWIDLRRRHRWLPPRRLPRMRGDRDRGQTCAGCSGRGLPRMRGIDPPGPPRPPGPCRLPRMRDRPEPWFVVKDVIGVYPACAGIDLHPGPGAWTAVVYPACADRPKSFNGVLRQYWFTPHAWIDRRLKT